MIRPFFSSSTILETWARWRQLERDFTILSEARASDAADVTNREAAICWDGAA
jgi:hypothetical protein